jgi:serine/threonine protein kinase
MSLAPGSRLGDYEIVAPLGAGGMGEVYRARDAKLRREVALKVLPQAFAGDPDRLARFEREAQAVAARSHPNILAIHDFGSDGKITYAVTELLEGQTLRDVIRHGGLSRRKALDYARQVASALDAGVRAGWKDAIFLRRDPLLAGLRDDPRFAAIVQQVEREVGQMRARADFSNLDKWAGAPVVRQ